MTTNEIISKIYNDQLEKKLTKKQIQLVIANFFNYAREDLEDGNRLAMPGFGIFKVVDRKEKEVTTPGGKLVKVPACKAVKFQASQMLKDAVNGKLVK